MKTLCAQTLALAVVLCGATGQAATATWNNGTGDGNWNTANNWSTGAVPGTADTANFNGTAGTITISAANASVQTLTKSGPQSVTIAGPGSLTIGTGGIARTGGNPANILTITANIIIGSSGQTWQIGGNGNTTTFSGTVSGGAFVKTGVGILLLSGSNTFTGATVNAGTLEATTANALGSGTITLGSGSTLNISSATGLSLPVSVTTSANATLNVQGGAVTHSIASLTDNNTLTLTNANGASLSVGILTVNATVNGGPTLTVTGTLTGAGNLNSAVTLGAGANLTPVAGLRTGALTMNNATNYNVAGSVPTITVNGALVLGGVLTVTPAAGLTVGTHTLMTATGTITDNHLQISSATVPAGFNIGTKVVAGAVDLIVTARALGLNVAKIQAVFDSRHTQVAWTMGQEQRTLGYRLWKEVGGARVRVGPDFLPGGAVRMATDLKNGPNHVLEDWTTPPGGTYFIEALGMDGTTQWLGPVTAAPGDARPVPRLASDPSRTPLVLSHGPTPAKPLVKSSAVAAAPPGSAWSIAASSAVKINVNAPGIYRVSAESLFAVGLPMNVPLSSLSVSNEGNPIAFRALSADGVHLNAGDAIEFYGEGIDGRYTDTRVYWVTWTLGAGPQVVASSSPAGPTAGSSFPATLEFQDRINYFGGLKNGGQQKFFGPWVYSTPAVRTYSLPAFDLTSSLTSTLEVALQGVTSGQHSTQVLVNGVPIGTLTGVDTQLMTQTFQIPTGLLVVGDNTVQVVAPANGDVSFEAYQRLTYPQLYQATGGPLSFSAPGGSTVHLSGANAATTQVWDITDRAATVLVALSSDPNDASSALVNPPSGNQRSLYAFTEADVKTPLSVQANTPSTIHSGQADLVVVAHSSLISEMAPLVARRGAEGLRVALVNVDSVYDEFSNGEKDAAAIHDFLAYAWSNWSPKPRYALLVGSASYNPRNYGLAAGPSADLVPTPLVETEYMETGSDDAFVSFSEATIPDVAIGRLPISDASSAQQVVTKILGRGLVNYESRLLFVQDEDDPVSNFTSQTATVKNALPSWRARESTIARPSGLAEGSPQQVAADAVVHTSLLAALEYGPAMVNYLGHGNQGAWSGGILSDDDVSALGTGSGASVFFAGGCLNGYFVDEGAAFLAGALLSAPSGGAWAMIASSASTDPGDQATLALNLWRGALVDGLPLGDALVQAKKTVSDTNVRVSFELFGDPSTRMAPQKTVNGFASVAQTDVAPATGCGTPGSPVLALLPLVLLAAFRRARP